LKTRDKVLLCAAARHITFTRLADVLDTEKALGKEKQGMLPPIAVDYCCESVRYCL
jgi:hypothetical protein